MGRLQNGIIAIVVGAGTIGVIHGCNNVQGADQQPFVAQQTNLDSNTPVATPVVSTAHLESLAINPPNPKLGEDFDVIVSLDGPAPEAGASVTLGCGDHSQGTIDITAGQSSGRKTFTAIAGSFTYTATYNGISKQAIETNQAGDNKLGRTEDDKPDQEDEDDANSENKQKLRESILDLQSQLPDARQRDADNYASNMETVRSMIDKAREDQNEIDNLRAQGDDEDADRRQLVHNVAYGFLAGIVGGTAARVAQGNPPPWWKPTDSAKKIQDQIDIDQAKLDSLD